MPYFLRLASGVVFHGVTDDEGNTDIAHGSSAEPVKIYVGLAALKEISKFKGEA
jgi:hypothetical protein